MKSIIQIATGIGIVAALTLAAGAFTESTQTPPAGNVSPPIQEATLTNPIDQVKFGGLGVIGNFTVGPVSTAGNLPRYFQLDTVSLGSGGFPDLADCNAPEKLGRMFYDRDGNQLYICAARSGGFVWNFIEIKTF